MTMDIRNGRLIIDDQDDLLFTGEVHYWRLEPKSWRPVLEALRATGMHWVGTYVPWRVHDQGVHDYDFDGRTDPALNLPAFLDLCAELELSVYFRPGPLIVSEMACGGYPDWLGHSGPEYMVWTATGEVPQGFPGEGNPGRSPSYLHPTYLGHCRRYLTRVNEVISPYLHQNGGPIKLYQLDNEVSLICRDAMFQSDYNPHIVGTGGEYHQWLRQKYGKAADIPYANGGPLEEIQPPRDLDLFGRAPVSWYWDWAEFKEYILAEYIRRLKEIHLECGVEDVIFCTNFNPHRPNSMPNNWDRERQACTAANPGLVGYDFYRGPFLSRTGYGSLTRISRMLSSYFPLAWSAEFMCGFWREDYNGSSYPFAEHHEFMADAAIASGLKGISWYMFHDREHWGGSPVSRHGCKRYAHQALTEVMDFVNGAADFGALREPREVAVLSYRPYHRHTYVGDPSPAADSQVNVGEPSIDGIPAGRTSTEFEGLFQLLADAGYHPGVIDPDINAAALAEYPVLLAPTQTFMDADTQQLLLDYAEQGGSLIMGPAVPGRDLDLEECGRLAGVACSSLCSHPGRGTRVLCGIGEIVVEGEMYDVSGEPLITTQAGQTLVSEIKVGKGRIILLAAYIAQQDDPNELGDNAALLAHLLGHCGVEPCAVAAEPEVEVILLTGGGETYVYLLNHGRFSHETAVALRDIPQGTLHDLRSPGTIPVKGGRFTALVDAKRSRLFRLED